MQTEQNVLQESSNGTVHGEGPDAGSDKMHLQKGEHTRGTD